MSDLLKMVRRDGDGPGRGRFPGKSCGGACRKAPATARADGPKFGIAAMGRG